MDWILVALMSVGLLAVVPAWRMYYVAFFTTRRYRWFTVLACIVLPFVLAAPAFWMPFLLSAGKEVPKYQTLIDMLLYGGMPLGALALVAYVADFFSESPVRSTISGAACMALALLPLLYFFRVDYMHTEMNIQTILEPNQDFSRYFRLR